MVPTPVRLLIWTGVARQSAKRKDKSRHMTADMKSADISLIKRILPHRYPFLLIDKVVDIDGTSAARGIKNVTYNEPQFQGHFPEAPIMPGIMLVEAMGQTAGVMIGVGCDLIDREPLIYFTSIEKCKFRRKVVPGDVVHFDIKTLRGRPGAKMWRLAGRATVDGELAAEAEIAAMLDLK